MRETVDEDGAARLTLIGELDMAVAEAVQDRLRQHLENGQHMRLDLAQLEFIDSSGVQAIVQGLRRARRCGREIEVDRRVSPVVARMIEMMGIGPQLWPDAPA